MIKQCAQQFSPTLMKFDLGQELQRHLSQGKLYPHYQPVVAFSQARIIGYSGVVYASPDSLLHAPSLLRECAYRENRCLDLDVLGAKLLIKQFARLQLPGVLFLPLYYSTLHQNKLIPLKLVKRLEKIGLSPQRLIIELHSLPSDIKPKEVEKQLQSYFEAGFRFALRGLYLSNELAASGHILYWNPAQDILHHIYEDGARQRFLGECLHQAQQQGVHWLFNGIENEHDYLALKECGGEFGQGNYFSPPKANPPIALAQHLFSCQIERSAHLLSREAVGEQAVAIAFIAPEQATEEVSQIFRLSPNLQALPVVRERQPIGIIRRQTLSDLFLLPFGRDLHGKKPIIEFMDDNPLLLEHDLPIEVASRRISVASTTAVAQDFIITCGGEYYGMGHIGDILQRMTELQIRNASYANPLTHLPGNVPIEEEINRLLQQNIVFVACYCDLDNFKPFNDHYGYSQGDEVIRSLAELLKTHIQAEMDFIGHVGGDDFIVLFCSEDWEARCQQILNEFAEQAPRFYSEQDRQRGGIHSHDRQGKAVFFDLLSLSIGAAYPEDCRSHHCVAARATEAKKQAKRQSGNSLFLERRKYHPGEGGVKNLSDEESKAKTLPVERRI